jgi:hypothetical protein
MLDVHPPEHAAHTWRDFFIHIATIVIGLLIAISLEQTVEFLHTRHEIAETRRTLHTERLININRFAANTAESRHFVPILQRDLAVFVYLRDHPHAPPAEWPAQPNWNAFSFNPVLAAWNTAQQNNVLPHMPPAEVRHDASLYSSLSLLGDLMSAERTDLANATRFAIIDPDPSHFTPAQIDREIDLVAQALQDYSNTANAQFNLNSHFPDFTPAPTRDEVLATRHRHDDPAEFARSGRIIDNVYNYEKSLSTEDSRP